MTLQIRGERARELAERLARKRNVTMTAAVIQALEEELRREGAKTPLSTQIAKSLKLQAGPNKRAVTKAEIDDMWGQP
jgi:antitoxin VapB